MLRTNWTSQAIDDVLAGTFPASDPPAWTPGMARPAPEIGTPAAFTGAARDDTSHVRAAGIIDVSRPSERTFAQALVSLLGAVGIALLVPFAILAVATPVALAIGGLLEAARWFVAIIR